jgi:hypothetical protein
MVISHERGKDRELLTTSCSSFFDLRVQDARQYLKVGVLFLYMNEENKNIKDANNMLTNSRDLIKVERYVLEVYMVIQKT